MQNDLPRLAGDVTATGVAIGSILGYLPAVAAVVSIVWFGIQIFESKTMQYWIKRWRNKS